MLKRMTRGRQVSHQRWIWRIPSAGEEAHKRGNTSWLWNPGQTSPEDQNRSISGPTKRNDVLKKKHNDTCCNWYFTLCCVLCFLKLLTYKEKRKYIFKIIKLKKKDSDNLTAALSTSLSLHAFLHFIWDQIQND